MDRRDLLLTALAGTAAAALTPAAGAADAKPAHAHGAASDGVNWPVLEAALHCARDGEVCLAHCIEFLSRGDDSLAECARSVSELVPVCRALATLAAQRSPHLAAQAKVALAICKECEAACRKHAEHHAFCKACADSCADCIKACESLQG